MITKKWIYDIEKFLTYVKSNRETFLGHLVLYNTIQYNTMSYNTKMFIQGYHIGIATFPGALLTNKGI